MNYCYFVLYQNSIKWFVLFNYRHKNNFFHIDFKIMKKNVIINLEVNKADAPKLLCWQVGFVLLFHENMYCSHI